MSEQEKPEVNALQEVSRKVVITPEDVAGAAEFWTHFDIPMSEGLKLAIEAFAMEQTIENQDRIKFEITKSIGWTDHEAFNDEMFKEIREECRNVNYDMSFDSSLEQILLEGQKEDQGNS